MTEPGAEPEPPPWLDSGASSSIGSAAQALHYQSPNSYSARLVAVGHRVEDLNKIFKKCRLCLRWKLCYSLTERCEECTDNLERGRIADAFATRSLYQGIRVGDNVTDGPVSTDAGEEEGGSQAPPSTPRRLRDHPRPPVPNQFVALVAHKLERVRTRRVQKKWGILLRKFLNYQRIFDVNVATVWFHLGNLPEDHPTLQQHHPLDPPGTIVGQQQQEEKVPGVPVGVEQQQQEEEVPEAPLQVQGPSRRRRIFACACRTLNLGTRFAFKVFARREWAELALSLAKQTARKSPYAAALVLLYNSLGNLPISFEQVRSLFEEL
jgi:hypothetical protein